MEDYEDYGMSIADYLAYRVHDQIGWYSAASGQYAIMYARIEWTLIISASLTPIFVIINNTFDPDHWSQWIPVVSSVIVAILSGGMKTFGYGEKSKKYAEKTGLLQNEMYQFKTNSGIYASMKSPESVFIERIEALLVKE